MKDEIMQMEYKNPDAKDSLYIPVLVVCNTPESELERNITINSAKDLPWLKAEKAHDGVAIMVGGGPSINDFPERILEYKKEGGTVFAMNAASDWCNRHSIAVDYQCILDAKEETAELVDHNALSHLFGSQVHPKTMDSVGRPIVWHLEIGEIEKYFPEERRKRGGYALLGGGAAVGNSALCAAYAMGFRKFHVFGYDSSNRKSNTHAYRQPMNKFIPNIKVEWAGKEYECSVAMKAQAEKFQLTSNALKNHGCEIRVYGDGLLPAMYNTPKDHLTEQDKYQMMWLFDAYREFSPGERIVDFYIDNFKPKGRVIDYGCGSGKAGIRMRERGLMPFLIDFADNCRDEEARSIPFLQWDLTNTIPMDSEHGFCTDVMEHIPPEDVETVIKNIMDSSDKVFFQICTVEDHFGGMVGAQLHLTVEPHEWWLDLFTRLGYTVFHDENLGETSIFYCLAHR